MKKILTLMVMIFAAISINAITIDEAYQQISAIPGASVTDVPNEECKQEGMDWGKVVMFMYADNTIINQVKKILAEISIPKVVDINEASSQQVWGYASKVDNDRTRALIYVSQTGAGCVILYAQGGDDILSDININ